MSTEWGAPLTGAQMKLLRAAGLDSAAKVRDCDGDVIVAMRRSFFELHGPFNLHADHPAYTLLKAGRLDGRNVRLWFGGDKAPDDWDGGRVLLSNGEWISSAMVKDHDWKHGADDEYDIIAYIAKAEEGGHPLDQMVALDEEFGLLDKPETVTIAKMTEAEWRKVWNGVEQEQHFIDTVEALGLIKPEPTRAERFTAETGIPVTADVQVALNFERD